VRFSTSKGQDLNCATKLLMFEASGIQETKKSNMDKFVRQRMNSSDIHAIASTTIGFLSELAERFQFRDSLLASEGQVPVYYWLYKHLKTESKDKFRDFIELVQTDLKTRSNHVLSAKQSTEYMSASRSVNDKASHDTRFS